MSQGGWDDVSVQDIKKAVERQELEWEIAQALPEDQTLGGRLLQIRGRLENITNGWGEDPSIYYKDDIKLLLDLLESK